jgi:hypothetical protein
VADTVRPASVSALVAAAVVLTDVVVAFGFVVGFNQLGTQSPIDAVLPVALFSVGLGGILTLVAAVLGATSGADDADDRSPAALAPASLDAAGAAFGLGVVALAAVGWQWGVTTQAGIVGAYGIALLVQAERAVVLTARDDDRRPSTYRILLLVPEAVLFIGFAWAALADAGIRPFT